MLKRILLFQFFALFGKCSDVNGTHEIPVNTTNVTIDGNTNSSFYLKMSPKTYTKGCSSPGTHCNLCEVCVDDQCLPFVMKNIYYENCSSLVDHCKKKTCKFGKCVSSYGDYLCECPRGKYGRNCGLTWKGQSKRMFIIQF